MLQRPYYTAACVGLNEADSKTNKQASIRCGEWVCAQNIKILKKKKHSRRAEKKKRGGFGGGGGGKEGERGSERRNTSLGSKTEKKKNFRPSRTHISVSLPKVQMISLWTNPVTKLLARAVHTGLRQM